MVVIPLFRFKKWLKIWQLGVVQNKLTQRKKDKTLPFTEKLPVHGGPRTCLPKAQGAPEVMTYEPSIFIVA